uniref:Cyclin B1 n=1 Tax=Hucho hucho TaxID=62062 RepID=A0A4W5JY42_9TELE
MLIQYAKIRVVISSWMLSVVQLHREFHPLLYILLFFKPSPFQLPLRSLRAFSHALLNIPDVDSADAGASSLCSDYVKDIYGCDVTGSMRRILVDWLVHVEAVQTIHLLIFFIHGFLFCSGLSSAKVSATGWCHFDSHHTLDGNDHSESHELGRPPPVHFLRRGTKPVDYGLAKYLLKLTLLDYASVHYPPSLTAAAAIALSSRILHDSAGYEWVTLQHYMGYTEVSLLPVMQFIAKMLERLNDGNMKQLSIKQKYENVKLLRVSCLPEMTSTRA